MIPALKRLLQNFRHKDGSVKSPDRLIGELEARTVQKARVVRGSGSRAQFRSADQLLAGFPIL